MQTYIQRYLTDHILKRLRHYPAVALLGPRQCGKTTLAKQIISRIKNAVYLDLERPGDANKLRDPELFFELNSGKLICLDEIQVLPDIFTALRPILDEEGQNGRVFILGSASRDLVRQTSESLAGRISYLELTPFTLDEVGERALYTLWLRGGFPRSFLAPDDQVSFEWREDFIRTFLERDIPQLGFRIPAASIRRLWQMCAHMHGQLLNASRIGEAIGKSHHTVKSYMDILSETFILRLLPPFHSNLKKRLFKSPKIFIRDTGLLHCLLGIESHNELLGHPVFGASWEGLVIESIVSRTPGWQHYFYRTRSGVEIDLILKRGKRMVAVECKATKSPSPTKGFWQALKELNIKDAYIVAPVPESYPIEKGVKVISLHDAIKLFSNKKYNPLT